MTKSHPDKKGRDEVYQWIEILQEEPTNEEVQEKIVMQYNDLVESLARKYSKNSTIHEDLVQVGMIGLLAAVRRFDSSFGKSFESFAIPTIIGEIKRFIRDKTWSVHVPRRIKELGPKIKKTIEELTAKNQHTPTVAEIAEYLGVSEEDILETMEMGRSYKALSVDRKVEADSEGSTVALLDLVGDNEGGYENVDFKLILEKLFPIFSERKQSFLRCSFFEIISKKETGDFFGFWKWLFSQFKGRSLGNFRERFHLA